MIFQVLPPHLSGLESNVCHVCPRKFPPVSPDLGIQKKVTRNSEANLEDTLPKSNSSPLKNGWLEDTLFFCRNESLFFRGELSFGEGKLYNLVQIVVVVVAVVLKWGINNWGSRRGNHPLSMYHSEVKN